VPSVFTRIIRGEIPARFVWQDERSVAFLDARPLRPGHTLVVPRQEVDHWLDLEPSLLAHLTAVAQELGRALQHGFHPLRVGMLVAGLEVPHVHIHVVPIESLSHLSFAHRETQPRAEDLDRAAATIRSSLAELGIAPAG
jgi:histidine triad (HIT) family protein